jgi:hypothetical protein
LIIHYNKLAKPKKSAVYDIYWHFAVKRQQVFQKRAYGDLSPWTTDSILQRYKFTNVFRASDRVSQYLIRIQYEHHKETIENLFFKTLLFKLFNRIETYIYLQKSVGEITYEQFDFVLFDRLLTHRMSEGQRLYSAAYIMPSPGNVFRFKYKHSNHLALLQRLMQEGVPQRITECKSLEEIYQLLLSYPSLGSFLAFQYTIDVNYSTLTNFSEMEFVVAGPGAKSGIQKCFQSTGEFSNEDIIKWMCDLQGEECERLGVQTPTLFGRPLQLIDCQNLFCEVDKYLRVSNPALNEASGKTRIKQTYQDIRGPIQYFFPPKWDINQNVETIWRAKANENMFS